MKKEKQIDLVKKYHLQEALKRFQQINEYTFITSPMLDEDGDDEENNGDYMSSMQGGGDMPQDNPQGQPPMGQEQPPMGGNVPMQGNSQPSMNQGGDMGNGQPMPSDMGGEGMMPPQGNEEMPNDGYFDDDETDEENDDNTEIDEDGDTVIDVDDLTQSQEASEIKLDGVDDKLTRMLKVLDKFNAALEASDRKIEDLKQEFERRNPSEQEKLNIRSQASYPYAETPKEFWDEKVKTNPHYNVIYDNDVPTSEEDKKFDITTDDLKNINIKDLSKSFDLDNMKIEDFVNF